MTAPTVLHVTAVKIGGGVPRYIESLVAEAMKQGTRHHVACDQISQLYGRLMPSTHLHRLHGGGRTPLDLWQSIRQLRATVDRVAPDIIHLHSSVAGVVGRIGLDRDQPVIFQPHAWSFHAVEPWLKPPVIAMEALLSRRQDLTVCGSNGEADKGRSYRLLQESRVIPNAVDTNHFVPVCAATRRRLKEDLLGDADATTVVAVNRLAPQKDPLTLLDAWDLIRTDLPGARLVVVGDGPMGETARSRAHHSVRFVGEIEDPAPWHQIADVSLISSRYETLSLSMLEALACGSPVVSTDVCGAADAILAGDSQPAGWVTPIGDAGKLAAAVVAVAGQSCDTMRRAARERAVAQFDVKPWVETWLQLYEEIAR